MKILIACRAFKIGGVSTFCINLGSALRCAGHETLALVTHTEGELQSAFKDAFAHTAVLPRRLEGPKKYVKRLNAHIRDWDPDVVISNTVNYYVQASFPLLPERMVKISVIHSLQESEVLVGTANNQYTDHVIAVAENIVEHAAAIARPRSISVIPVGIELQPPPDRPEIEPDEPVRLVYIGRLSSIAKNVHVLPSITDQLHAGGALFELTIIGEGERRSALEKIFSARPYHQNITFTGSIAPSQVTGHLEKQHILLLPSSYESTPHAVIEAMSLGVLPIASRIRGATDRIITHGHSGFLCSMPPRASEYADTIMHVTRNRRLFAEMADRAIADSKKFDINSVTSRYLDLIDDLIRRKPAPGCAGSGPDLNKFRIPPELRKLMPSPARSAANRLRKKVAQLARATNILRKKKD